MMKILNWTKWAITLLVVAMLLGSGCTLVAPPSFTPPPSSTPAPPLLQSENNIPVISYITSQQQVAPSSNSVMQCVATDADSDSLTYFWLASGGTILGAGDTITWTAPEAPGAYTITATVKDDKGGEAKDSVTIAVMPKPNRAPVVTLIVGDKTKPRVTVTTTTATITTKRWTSPEIECKAEDPDGDQLSYKWSAAGGKIEGEGPKVYYIASATGDYAVTVTVTDSRGAQTKSSVFFHVPCCGGF